MSLNPVTPVTNRGVKTPWLSTEPPAGTTVLAVDEDGVKSQTAADMRTLMSAVSYASQSLTDEQQLQARANLSFNLRDVTLYGADPTGVADSTTAILAADAAAEASGGDVYFPSGTYRVDGLLRLADTASGAAIRTMRPRRWIGDGSWKDTTASTELASQGTILDCRNNTAPSLLLKPRGSFEMRGITISNLGTAHTQPMLKITNTVAHIIDCSFIGHSSKNGATCDQPGIVFGGTTSASIGNDDDSPFQGYGTTIERCYFERINHVATWQMFANDIKFINNVVWAGCGGDTVFVCDPVMAAQYSAGALIADNTVEMLNYSTFAKLDHAVSWWFRGNGLYDAGTLDPLGIIHLTDSPTIRIDNGLMPAYTKLIKDNGGSTWTFFSTVQGDETYFGPLFPLRADLFKSRSILADAGYEQIICKAHSGHTEVNTDIVGVAARAKDDSKYFEQLRSGAITLGGTVATSIDAIAWTLKNDGFRRKDAGGNIWFDSGTGGSVNTHIGYRHVFNDHTGAELARMQATLTSLETPFVFKPEASTTLTVNGQMTFDRVSNTQVKLKLRGDDGVTRETTLTLS